MTPEEAFRRHAEELTRFASGLVGPSDAHDVVADGCLKAFASPKWSMLENPRAYLYRTVLNQARMVSRSTIRRRAREARAVLALPYPPITVDPGVLEAVSRLSVRQRAVVFLTYWEDLHQRDIAARLGISEGSVRRHLARAHHRLKETLDV
jgi:RNA polymerase sigma-70 factor (ECF subfamily)